MAKYTIETDGNTADDIGGYLGIRIEICNKRTWVKTDLELTPYTESDIEQVRKEEYEKGFKNAVHNCPGGCLYVEQARKEAYAEGRKVGIKDGKCEAWEATRKISHMSMAERNEVFGNFKMVGVTDNFSASEVIEKIRQYEQEKEKKDSVWIASETWIVSEANEPSVDTTLICSKCGYAITIKPHETPALNFCPKCGDCKKPKEEES